MHIRSSNVTCICDWPRIRRQLEPSPPHTPQLSGLVLLPSCLSQPTSCRVKRKKESKKGAKHDIGLFIVYWLNHLEMMRPKTLSGLLLEFSNRSIHPSSSVYPRMVIGQQTKQRCPDHFSIATSSSSSNEYLDTSRPDKTYNLSILLLICAGLISPLPCSKLRSIQEVWRIQLPEPP